MQLPLPRPRRVALTLVPLLLAAGLSACGGDHGAINAGDVIPARTGLSVAGKGVETTIALPTGLIRVSVGEPVGEVSAKDTRELAKLTAPEGQVLLPLTWSLDTSAVSTYAPYRESTATAVVDLVVDGASYRIPAPDGRDATPETFYVTVAAPGGSPELKIDYGGVVQTADLTTGEVEAGRAEALYDLDNTPAEPRPCGGEVRYSRAPAATVTAQTFTCTVTPARRLPYADGRWAEEGSTWLVTTIETTLGRWDEATPDLAGGAIYYAGQVQGTFTLGDIEATRVLDDPGRGRCPDLADHNCRAVFHVLFEVPDKAPKQLTIRPTFQLNRASTWGEFKSPRQLELTVTDRTRMPVE